MKRLNGTKELTNFQRKKMEKKIAKQQAISQEQREENFANRQQPKADSGQPTAETPKHRYYPKDLDNFIRDNERKQNAQNRTPKPPAIHHLKVNLSFWQRLRVLFGATPTLAVSFDRNKNHAENIGTIL